jgi:hypothetical protein
VLDVWAARRGRDVAPPTAAWQWQLGMRPWNVFVAQVLQFQDQLAELYDIDSPLSRASATQGVISKIDDISALVMSSVKTRTKQRLEELAQEFRGGDLGEQVTGRSLVALRALGIGALPPAGFLPVFGATTAVAAGATVRELLGGAADVRVCTGGMGDVGGFVARAQHRERISLDAKGREAIVDVLWVEDARSDWVAFARREETDCGRVLRESSTEPVEVYVVEQRSDDTLYNAWRKYLEKPSGPLPRLPEHAVELHYPVRTWALPEEREYADLVRRISDLADQQLRIDLVAIVTEDVRRQLGVARATILGLVCTEARTTGHDTVSTLGSVEAIVVLAGVEAR